MENLDQLRDDILRRVGAADTPEALDQVRVGALGKKGSISGLMKTLGELAPEARKAAGAALNRLKDEVAAAIEAAAMRLKDQALDERVARERVDITLPV